MELSEFLNGGATTNSAAPSGGASQSATTVPGGGPTQLPPTPPGLGGVGNAAYNVNPAGLKQYSYGQPVGYGVFNPGAFDQGTYRGQDYQQLADQNGAVNAYGIAYDSESYGSRSLAAISRQDWGQFQQYYQPLEQKLANMVGSNSYATQQVNDASNNFTSQFDASKGQYQRDLSRYGLTMNSQEQQSYNRLSGESRALGQVNAINSANRGVGQLEMNILGGGAQSPLTTALQSLPPQALGK